MKKEESIKNFKKIKDQYQALENYCGDDVKTLSGNWK